MPMMRRGPLDRYPAESVLRQASAHQVTGGVEFHSDAPATFYFTNGRVYAANVGVDLGPEGPDVAPCDQQTARQATVALLAANIGLKDGWYYHDPLTRHRWLGEWDWDAASLIMESRALQDPPAEPSAPARAEPTDAAPVHAAPAPPAAEQAVQLRATGTSVMLSADAWSLVVALAGQDTASALADQLGWEQIRVDDAIGELGRRQVLDGPERAGSNGHAHAPPPPTGPQLATANGRHVGPLPPPPTIEPTTTPADRRRRRRR